MPSAEEAIVLAGGLGTRLRSVVADLPKALAPVAGRPFLTYLLDQLAANGLRRVILATGYMAETVQRTIGTNWAGMDIVYSQEPEPLGTGGAVRLASTLLQGKGVHLLNGDTFLRYEMSAMEQVVRGSGAALGVALARVDDVGRYGVVEVENERVSAFDEKGATGPGLINAGCYFLTASGLDMLPGDNGAYSFETQVLVPRARVGELIAFTNTRDFIDIGVPEDFARAQQLFAP